MFGLRFAPLLALLTLAGTASALAAEAPSRSAPAPTAAAVQPAADQRAASAAVPEGSRPELSLLFVLAFASVGGGVGLIAAGRGAAEPRSSE
ncbi:MAG: hypothetical protein JO083_05495 [Candidatus Eremiobacteraeota bacterium]|nr:hypothetical protein [Candidatus Eremiobacteraeota bacterium]